MYTCRIDKQVTMHMCHSVNKKQAECKKQSNSIDETIDVPIDVHAERRVGPKFMYPLCF